MKPKLNKKLNKIYKKLYHHFGPRRWWPGDTKFEIIVGAILTQNTNWRNVEKAIDNLKKKKLLNPASLYKIPSKNLGALIKPSGYYNIKTKRLKEFMRYLFKKHGGSLRKMFDQDLHALRRELLEVKGIGPETADSILLYAGEKPIFVIDAYTKRILERHSLIDKDATYHQTQELFMNNLNKNVKLFNEYHALLVELGKTLCKKKPNCDSCPLKGL